MRLNLTALAFLFTLLAFILASLLGVAPAFAQPGCMGGAFTDTDTDVDDDDDGLIEICTLTGLNAVRHNLAGTSYKASSGTEGVQCGASSDTDCEGYELVEDLDFEDTTDAGYDVAWTSGGGGAGWIPIGTLSSAFLGDFDGNGFEIHNLYLTGAKQVSGIFGHISGGVRNLGLQDVNMTVSSGGLPQFHGVLAGAFTGTGAVSGCYVTGSITTSANLGKVGGLIGSANGTVSNCYAAVDITTAGSESIGGLIGSIEGGTFTSCYATGSISDGSGRIGGLVGTILGGTLSNSYSTGAVSGGPEVGGLVGNAGASATITGSFWDTTSSVQDMSDGTGATGKSTADMKALTGEAGSTNWGTDDWDFGDSTQYPALKRGVSVVAGQPCPRVECDPLVSIAARTSPVTEGTAAEFTLTRTGSTDGELTVAVTVTGGDGFLSGAATTEAVFSAGEATVTLSLATEGDEVGEADGTVTVTITADVSKYRLGDAAASVAVEDDDLPVVSIAAGTSPVTEGTAAEFTLTRMGDTTAALTVMVVVTGGDDFLSGAAPTQAVFAIGEATVTLSLATEGDEVDEADGTVTVTITAEASKFRLGDAAASVAVEDDDLPVVSIAAGTASVMEGTAAEFTLTRVGDTTDALTAPVSVTGGDSFLSGAAPTQAVFAVGEATVTLSLSTDDDDMDEANGTVTVTVTEAATSYRVDTGNSSATVTITDDDDTPPGTTLSFSGTVTAQVYTKNTAITDLVLPGATGGMGMLTYTLTPVPDGLMFDANTRTLSGMPTTVAAPGTTHTYTVTDSGNPMETTTVTFTITVNPEGTPTFADTVADQIYTENTEITPLILPVATGGMGPYTYALTPVPDGLSFDAGTRMLSGTPSTPAITAHTYTVTDSTPDAALTMAQTFTITVNAEGSPMFSDTVTDQIYTKDTAITDLVLPEATGGMGGPHIRPHPCA